VLKNYTVSKRYNQSLYLCNNILTVFLGGLKEVLPH